MTPPRRYSAAPTSESDTSSSLQAPKFFRVLVLALAFVGASFSLSFVASLVTATPASALIEGVDVSNWQGNIDWPAVPSSQFRFAIIKASEGTTYTDPFFQRNWEGAGSRGMFRGAYHFARPAGSTIAEIDADARAEAYWFVSRIATVGGMGGSMDLPAVLDLEYPGDWRAGVSAPAYKCWFMSQSQLSQWMRTWLSTVHTLTGKVPILYTNSDYWNSCDGAPADIASTYRLWLASWGVSNPSIPSPWRSWTFWQDGGAPVPGIGSAIDHNYFCCDERSLQALAGSGGGSPFGSFDGTALNSANNIHVAGWAIDPDTTAPIQVHFYTDGAWTGATTADRIRTDVGAVYPGFGSAHGFSADFAIPTGAQNMCAFGINVASGLNLPLGCLSLGGAPKGSLDMATVTQPGKVRVAGWAADPNDWSRSTVVHVYAGTAWTSLPANQLRTDVNNFFGITGNHGFNAEVDASGGPIQVCVYGINDTGPGGPSLLSCKSVTVPTGSPYGSLDVVKARPGAIDIAGWVIDPDTANPTQVHVYVDGVGVAIVASAPRPDVAAAFPLYGANHGFSTSIPVSAGSHQVCVYSINTVGAGSNQTLGCRTVVSRNGDPFGSIDWAASGYGHIGVAGWALDPNTDDPIVIHIYVNGVGVGRLASDYRADVAAAFGNGPNHGFTYVVPRPSADPQTICVFGLNVGAGTNSLIGCRVV